MKKFLRKIHLWLSIPFGLIITTICFTGAMLVFETEITEFCYPDRYFVKEVKDRPIPVDQLMEMLSQTLPDSVTVSNVTISSDSRRAYQVGLSKPRRASVYIDQYTGEVKPRFERVAFFSFMFRMHRWLLDSMKPDGGIFWGKMIVGTSTLFFVIILLTGIIIWIPRTYKVLRNRLKISFHKGWRRFWLDLHMAGGMYTVVVLLTLALTGLTWSFQWYRAVFYKVFGVEMQQNQHGQQPAATSKEHNRGQSKQGGKRASESKPSTAFVCWQKVYDQLNNLNPDNNQITVSANTANVYNKRLGNQRGSDQYKYDPSTGNITEATPYKEQDKSNKIRGWIYSVHVGNWGGILTRIITFIAALIGASLPLTGYYFWIKKLISRRLKKKNFIM